MDVRRPSDETQVHEYNFEFIQLYCSNSEDQKDAMLSSYPPIIKHEWRPCITSVIAEVHIEDRIFGLYQPWNLFSSCLQNKTTSGIACSPVLDCTPK